MSDLCPPGSDEKNETATFTLAHEHLPGRRGQRPQLRRQRRQILAEQPAKIPIPRVRGTDSTQAGHVTRGYGVFVVASNQRGLVPWTGLSFSSE